MVKWLGKGWGEIKGIGGVGSVQEKKGKHYLIKKLYIIKKNKIKNAKLGT